MKKIIALLSLLSISSTVVFADADTTGAAKNKSTASSFTDQMQSFLKQNTDVQKKIRAMEKQHRLICGEFAEFYPIHREALEQSKKDIESCLSDNICSGRSSQKPELKNTLNELKQTLAEWPGGVSEIILGQAECGPGVGQKGVAVVLGISEQSDKVIFNLISATKY